MRRYAPLTIPRPCRPTCPAYSWLAPSPRAAKPPARDAKDLVAYLSAEFGIHESLPIYSGGLGVLAGDHLKSASDLGLPLVAVGLFYREGYFRQQLDETGWQIERYPENDPALLPLHLALQILVFVAGLLVVAWFAKLRGLVCARAFARTLLNRSGTPTRLADVHRNVEHVLCAADLHSGELVYFSGGFVCAYRYGIGSAGHVWLHDAVHASAAYPGGFPVRRFATEPHRFSGAADGEAKQTRHMVLLDGGVYDNMADEWALGARERNRRWASLASFSEPDELVVVNASAAMGWKSMRRLSLPLLGEMLTLKRDIDILYDVSTSTRRRWLVDRFDAGVEGMSGALVHIAQSPFRVPSLIVERLPAGDERVGRAQAVLAKLGDGEARWQEVVGVTRGVKTTLSKVGEEKAARLVEHGYVLALANLHVHLGYPLLDMPPPERFDALVRGGTGP
jgi:predicted acylesterase/phospholipase RssA